MTPNEDASLEHGDSLLDKVIAGNFRVQRLIGSGAMGHVYQAEQLSLGKAVAIKVLHPQLMGDANLVRRFQREAKSASRLNHPNSIQIIDSGQEATGVLYIAMELLTGRDLAQVIRDEFPLPLARVVRIMSQVLSALDEAHAQGVIHRDLKPSNIMLIERRGESDFVKVCDYGIAKAQLEEGADEAQMLTIQGLVCGTPEYMSPEQARGEPLDGRTDLYSVAVILYHLVTGDIPFRAATPIGIVSRHLSEAPALPSSRRPDPSIPPELDDLILRGLAKSRELRPASARIFREELESIGAGRGGRHARSTSETVPAAQAADDGGRTTQLPARARAPEPRRIRGGRVLAIGLLVASGAASAGLIAVRRSSQVLGVAKARLAELARPETGAATGTPPLDRDRGPTIKALPAAAQTPQATEAPDEPLDQPLKMKGAALAPAQGTPTLRDPAAVGVEPDGERDMPSPGPAAKRRAAATGARDRDANRKRETVRGSAASEVAPAGAAPGGAAQPATTGQLAPTAVAGRTESGASPAASMAASGDGKTAAPGGLRETIASAEKLLAQGEVTEACRRGEDAKTSAPHIAAAYKFLGKCYMRAGNAQRAKENYRRYLDLAPNAPDAVFIESILK